MSFVSSATGLWWARYGVSANHRSAFWGCIVKVEVLARLRLQGGALLAPEQFPCHGFGQHELADLFRLGLCHSTPHAC